MNSRKKITNYALFAVFVLVSIVYTMLGRLEFQIWLLEQYSLEKDGGFNVNRAVKYLKITPRKNSKVDFVFEQGGAAQKIAMIDALIIILHTDVGMSKEESKMLNMAVAEIKGENQ